MKQLVFVFLIAFAFLMNTYSGKGQDVKNNVIDYLIKKGELSSTIDKNKYGNVIFILDIVKYNDFNKNRLGVYKFGIFSDHSKSFLLFYDGVKNEIFDLQNLDIILFKEIAFLKKIKKTPYETLKCIEATINIYQKNLNVIPWTD